MDKGGKDGIPIVLKQSLEVREAEEVWSRKIDQAIVGQGYRPIKWARCCFTLTAIYTVLNLLAGLYRADFLNITVCAVAIFLLTNPGEVNKSHFRLLVFGTFVSIVYDGLWHAMQSQSEQEAEDGGVQNTLRSF